MRRVRSVRRARSVRRVRRISENNLFAGIKGMTFKMLIIHENNRFFDVWIMLLSL